MLLNTKNRGWPRYELQVGRVCYESVTICLPCSVLFLDQLLWLATVGDMVLDQMDHPSLSLEIALQINIIIQIVEKDSNSKQVVHH